MARREALSCARGHAGILPRDRAARPPPLRLDKDGIEHLKRFEDNRDAELEAMD